MDFLPNRKRGDYPSKNRIPAKSGDVWSAFDDFFNSRLGELPTTSELNNFSPEVNIKETDDKYIIEAEMAGLKRDEIDVEIRGDELILKGDKKSFKEDEKEDYYHMERRYGSFYRSIPLDENVNTDKCDASFEDGLLRVELAKKSEKKRKAKKVNIH